MKPYILLTCVFVFCIQTLSAQVSLERQVIASTGNFSTSATLHLSSTVGETVPQTLIGGTLVLTQGFQQPDRNYWGTGVEELFKIIVDYKVFPNPTSDLLTIRLESGKLVVLTVQLSDLTGRKLPELTKQLSGNGIFETQMSLAGLAEGIYLLTFLDDKGRILSAHKVSKK